MCAYFIYYISFFVYNEGSSKTHQSSLTLKGGSTAFPKPIFSWRRLAALGIVQANLTLLSFAQPFPSGDKGCANRPFNSLYDPFGSPCRGQKRCSNRYAIWLADHQRSTPAAELRFLCVMNRMDTLFRMFAACSMLKGCLLDACCLLELLFEGTADKMDGALRNLLILSSYSP